MINNKRAAVSWPYYTYIQAGGITDCTGAMLGRYNGITDCNGAMLGRYNGITDCNGQ